MAKFVGEQRQPACRRVAGVLQDDDTAPLTAEAGAMKRARIAQRQDRHADARGISQRGEQQDLRVEVRGFLLRGDRRGDLIDRGADRLGIARQPCREMRRGAQHNVGEALGVAGVGVEPGWCSGARDPESSGGCERWHLSRRQQVLDRHGEQAGDTLGRGKHLCLAGGPG